MPVFMPKPPVGVNRCTASPASTTRLVDEALGHQRDARGPRPVTDDPDRQVGADRAHDHRGPRSRRVGGVPSSGALENARNSSSSLSEMMVQRPLRMDHPVVPARPVREVIAVERRRAKVCGVLPAAIVRRVERGEAVIAQRQRAAHEAAPAVAAGEILRAPALAAAVGLRLDRDAVGVLLEAGHLPAEANGDVRAACARARAGTPRHTSGWRGAAARGSGRWRRRWRPRAACRPPTACGMRPSSQPVRRGVVADIGRPVDRQAEIADRGAMPSRR